MNIFLKNIKINILTFFVLFSVILIYYSIGPTIWIDSLFHVAYAETFFSSDNYRNWYVNNLIYHYHEGFGFGVIWKISQIFGLKYGWLIFAFIQNTLFVISLIYLHSSLEIYFKTKLKFYTLIFIYSSTFILFFNNSYMTESVPISLIILSFSIYLRIINNKNNLNDSIIWKTILIFFIIGFTISQFRIHWTFFPSFILLIIFIQLKIIKVKFLFAYFIFNLFIIVFNPFINYLELNNFKIQLYGVNKVRLLSSVIANDLSIETKKKISLKTEKLLDKQNLKFNGKKGSFFDILTDHSKLAKYTKEKIKNENSIFYIDDVFQEIYKKIYLENDKIKKLEKNYKLKFFFWNSGLTFLFQDKEKTDKKQFRSYYRYLSKPDSAEGRFALSKAYFSNINLPNINNNQDKIFDSTKGVFYKDKILKVTHKIFSIILFTKNLNYEIVSIISLLLILYLMKSYLYLSITFLSTIVVNNVVVSNSLLCDARMMLLNYLIYVLVISFLIAKIQSKLHSK